MAQSQIKDFVCIVCKVDCQTLRGLESHHIENHDVYYSSQEEASSSSFSSSEEDGTDVSEVMSDQESDQDYDPNGEVKRQVKRKRNVKSLGKGKAVGKGKGKAVGKGKGKSASKAKFVGGKKFVKNKVVSTQLIYIIVFLFNLIKA